MENKNQINQRAEELKRQIEEMEKVRQGRFEEFKFGFEVNPISLMR